MHAEKRSHTTAMDARMKRRRGEKSVCWKIIIDIAINLRFVFGDKIFNRSADLLSLVVVFD